MQHRFSILLQKYSVKFHFPTHTQNFPHLHDLFPLKTFLYSKIPPHNQLKLALMIHVCHTLSQCSLSLSFLPHSMLSSHAQFLISHLVSTLSSFDRVRDLFKLCSTLLHSPPFSSTLVSPIKFH